MSYNVYSIKVETGEEVIAKSDKKLENWFQEDTVAIKQPLTLIQTQQGVGAMPWIGTGDTEEVILPTSKIIAIVKSKSEVESMYVKSTSGIDIATADTSSLIM